MSIDKRSSPRPEGRKRTSIVEDVHVEAIFHLVIAHEAENVVIDITEEVNLSVVSRDRTVHLETSITDIRFHTPVPVEVFQSWMLVEESTVPPTHMTITDHPSFADSNSSEVF